MNALVTGASGFTGSHLALQLFRAGDWVKALVRKPTPIKMFERTTIAPVIGDLLDPGSLRRALEGVDVVYNLAALYREAGRPAAEYRAVNALAVGVIVELAKAAGVKRVVHCSTVGVHGDIAHPPANENAPLRPGDIYQDTKLEGEQIGRETAKRVGMDLVIVRPSGIYGPHDRRLFKLFGAIAQRRFVMLGSGRNFYHVTYIDDLCDGFRLCGTAPRAANRTYILAGGEVTTLRELVDVTADVAKVPRPRSKFPVWPVWVAGALCELACAPFGVSPPLYRRRVDFFRKSRAFDISRARQELGFAPRIGLREGIGRTLEWYREQGWI